jgi:hypothetical protein
VAKSLVSKIVKKKESQVDLSKIADHIHEGQFKVNTRSGFTQKKTFPLEMLANTNKHGHKQTIALLTIFKK